MLPGLSDPANDLAKAKTLNKSAREPSQLRRNRKVHVSTSGTYTVMDPLYKPKSMTIRQIRAAVRKWREEEAAQGKSEK